MRQSGGCSALQDWRLPEQKLWEPEAPGLFSSSTVISPTLFILEINPASCSPTVVAWHPHHRSTIAVGEFNEQVCSFSFSSSSSRDCLFFVQAMNWAVSGWRISWGQKPLGWSRFTVAGLTGSPSPPTGSDLSRQTALECFPSLSNAVCVCPAPRFWPQSAMTALSLFWTLTFRKCELPLLHL